MSKALINFNKQEDMVLGVVKSIFGFKTKEQTVRYIVDEYAEELIEPHLKKEVVEQILAAKNEKGIKVKDFRKRYGMK